MRGNGYSQLHEQFYQQFGVDKRNRIGQVRRDFMAAFSACIVAISSGVYRFQDVCEANGFVLNPDESNFTEEGFVVVSRHRTAQVYHHCCSVFLLEIVSEGFCVALIPTAQTDGQPVVRR